MRTFASVGAAAIAASLFAAGSALAWTAEQPAQQNSNSVMYGDPDSFEALKNKVDGKSSQFQSGFYISGSANSGDPSPMGPPSRLQGSGSASSYAPPANLPPCFYGGCGR